MIAAGEHLLRYAKRPETKGLEGGVPSALKNAASDVGDLSEKQIIEAVRSYCSASRLQLEVEVVR
jgi:sRNA-binding protein